MFYKKKYIKYCFVKKKEEKVLYYKPIFQV